jgi:hypothetical protein
MRGLTKIVDLRSSVANALATRKDARRRDPPELPVHSGPPRDRDGMAMQCLQPDFPDFP